jgi:hypothetical protein
MRSLLVASWHVNALDAHPWNMSVPSQIHGMTRYFLVVPYYQICLTKHVLWHNRIVDGAILGCLVLANLPA